MRVTLLEIMWTIGTHCKRTCRCWAHSFRQNASYYCSKQSSSIMGSRSHILNALGQRTCNTLPVLLMLEEDRMKRRNRDNVSSSLMMAQSSHTTQFKPKYKFKYKRFKKQLIRKQDKKTSLEMLVINVVKEDITRSSVHWTKGPKTKARRLPWPSLKHWS